MSIKVNDRNINWTPFLPPGAIPQEPPRNQPLGKEPSGKIKGKSKATGNGSQRIGQGDRVADPALRQRPTADGVQERQAEGFEQRDSFRADEIQHSALQKQTIGDTLPFKQTRVQRQVSGSQVGASELNPGFANGQSQVSGSQTRVQARNIRRNSSLSSLREHFSTGRKSREDTIQTHISALGQNEGTRKAKAPQLEILSGMLQDTSADKQSRMEAALSLGQLQQPEASPALIQAAYGGERWEVREAAKHALSQLPQGSDQFLHQNFDQMSPDVQSAALDHFSRTPTEQSIQTFLHATDSPDQGIRHKALKKLESAFHFERNSGTSPFEGRPSLRQHVLDTAARLSRDADPTISSKAKDLLFIAAQQN